MRIAVISDIHGNLDAFKAVWADIDQSEVDAVLCLGDIVGYGPEPDQVAKQVKKRNIPTVIGNHDLAIIDPKLLRWFNPDARASLEMTVEMMSQNALDFIQSLGTSLVYNVCRFVHGFPPDSPLKYLFEITSGSLFSALNQMTEKICFVGHTHLLEMIRFDGSLVDRFPLDEGERSLNEAHKYILNIGSVGQPRDGNNNAKYVIFDTSQYTIDVKFIPYDIAKVVGKIIAAGLPEIHAHRLW